MDYQYNTHLPIAPLTVPKSTDPWVGVLVSPGCCITNDPIVNTYNSTITKIQNKTDMDRRLGKLACPRVNDDLRIHVDDHKLSSGCHMTTGFWRNCPMKYCVFFWFFFLLVILFCKRNTLEDDHNCLWTTNY